MIAIHMGKPALPQMMATVKMHLIHLKAEASVE